MIEPHRQPILRSALLEVRPSTAADWAPLYSVASDPELWTGHPAHDRWRAPIFREVFEAGLASGAAVRVIDRSTGAIIGSSRFSNWRPERDEIEIGWTFLARSHWGGIYNGELKRLMLGHIHRDVGTAIFIVGEDNQRSRRAVEKIGAVRMPGTEDRLMTGKVVRHIRFGVQRVHIDLLNQD